MTRAVIAREAAAVRATSNGARAYRGGALPHKRSMPLILAPRDYHRWLSDEPDRHELRGGPPQSCNSGMFFTSHVFTALHRGIPMQERSSRTAALGTAIDAALAEITYQRPTP